MAFGSQASRAPPQGGAKARSSVDRRRKAKCRRALTEGSRRQPRGKRGRHQMGAGGGPSESPAPPEGGEPGGCGEAHSPPRRNERRGTGGTGRGGGRGRRTAGRRAAGMDATSSASRQRPRTVARDNSNHHRNNHRQGCQRRRRRGAAVRTPGSTRGAKRRAAEASDRLAPRHEEPLLKGNGR